MLIVELGEFTFLIDSIARNNSLLSLNSFSPFKSSNEMIDLVYCIEKTHILPITVRFLLRKKFKLKIAMHRKLLILTKRAMGFWANYLVLPDRITSISVNAIL